jgi:hypothetical protein
MEPAELKSLELTLCYCDVRMFLGSSSFNDALIAKMVNEILIGKRLEGIDSGPIEIIVRDLLVATEENNEVRFAANIRTQHHPSGTVQPKAIPTYPCSSMSQLVETGWSASRPGRFII